MVKLIYGDKTTVMQNNLTLVLRHLQDDAALSRTQHSRSLDLNKSALSSLVEELIRLEMIHENYRCENLTPARNVRGL
jgi:hypothetical protein